MKGTLTLNLQSFSFQGVVTQNGDRLQINASNMPNNWNNRGIYINASDQAVTHNSILIPAYTILFPDDTSININSYSGIDEINFIGSDNTNDYFNGGSSTDFKDGSSYHWSAGNDQYIGTDDDARFNSWDWYWHVPQNQRGSQGLIIDNSSGTINLSTTYGTTTLTNVETVVGTPVNDTLTGNDSNEDFYPYGGVDIITGGNGSDQFADIYSYNGPLDQQKLTIKDYESFEEVEFEDATWDTNGSYNFTKANIANQFSVNYDTNSNSTLISIKTSSVDKKDFVILENGQFEISHYSLEDNLTGLELYLKDDQANNKNHYYIGDDVDVFGIKDFVSGDRIEFDDDFGFDSQNYGSQISVSYDSSQNKTLIDLNSTNFTKDDLVVVDGNFEVSSLELSNDKVRLNMDTPGARFTNKVTQNGNKITINAGHFPDLWSGRGLYVNASDQAVIYNNILIPDFTVLFPDNTGVDLKSFTGATQIDFKGSNNTNDYFNGGNYGYTYMRWSGGNDTLIGSVVSNEGRGEVAFWDWWSQQPSNQRTNQGLTLDNRTGTLTVTTTYGTTTASNIQYISPTEVDDIIFGGSWREILYSSGGSDTITGGAGIDRYNDIFPHQNKITITDYESYEQLRFENANWRSDGDYGFNVGNVENQFTVNYDSVNDKTNISINTSNVTNNNVVTLDNGEFVLSHYILEDNLDKLALYLKSPSANKNNFYTHQGGETEYKIQTDYDLMVIKDFISGEEFDFNDDFGFSSQNYANEILVNYNSQNQQTTISVNTSTYQKNNLVIIDGEFELGKLELEDDQEVEISLVTPGTRFANVITQNGDRLTIDTSGQLNLWNNRGVYINATDQIITHNNVNIPAFTVLFPDGTSSNLQSYNGVKSLWFEGSHNVNDYFNGGSIYEYTAMTWSTGTDTYVGSTNGSKVTGLIIPWTATKLTNQGLTIDNSSGTITVANNYGSMTATNIAYVGLSGLDDTVMGGSWSEEFFAGGGTDVITGGAGIDQFNEIFSNQTKLTITDYESYERLQFEDQWWNATSDYNFSLADIETQFSIAYSNSSNSTFISINTSAFNKNNVVELQNGNFILSYYDIEDNGKDLSIYLKSNTNPNKNSYSIGADKELFVIKDFVTGDALTLDGAFGFNSTNYADEIWVSYDPVQNRTLIDLNTSTITKDNIVVIDGRYALNSSTYGSSGDLILSLTTPGTNFDSFITKNGANLQINGAQIPNSWSGRGIYCNGSDTSVAFNGITIPAFKVLFPDNTSIDLQSYSGITGITFTGSDLTNDYFNGGVGNDVINGGDGNDTINGGGGNDTINAGDGDDVVIYNGEGNDTVTFGAGNDTLKVSNITGWSEYRNGDDLIIYANNGTNFIKVVGAYSTANRLENIEYTDSSVVRLVSVNSLVPSSGIHFFAGTSGDDMIEGGSASSVSATGYDGNDTLIGTAGRDFYGGNEGNDIIKTLAGDDVLIGGTGNDTLEGGNGNDIINGGEGNDTIQGGSGNDTIDFGAGNNTVNGGIGDDTYFSDSRISGKNTITDSGGTNDTLEVLDSKGQDSYRLYESNTAITWITASGQEVVMQKNQDGSKSIEYMTWVADPNKDNSYSAEYKNKLKLVSNVSEITDSHFMLAGTTGNDVINIPNGLTINSGVEQWGEIFLDKGDDIITLPNTFKYYTHGGDGNDTMIGGSSNDHLTGNAGNDSLNGGDGNDLLNGGSGADLINGGNGTDTIYLEADGTWNTPFTLHEAVNINSSNIIYYKVKINGKNKFEDVIQGGNNTDTINLTASSDAFFLHDTYANFHSSLSLSNDTFGNQNTDRIVSVETINGGDGDDLIDLTSPNTQLSDSMILNGGAGNDIIWSSAGTDILNGGDGDDILFGGNGIDELIGGNGADTFEFCNQSANDIIKDYNKTDGDKLAFFIQSGDSQSVSFSGDTITWGSLSIQLEGLTLYSTNDFLVEYNIVA